MASRNDCASGLDEGTFEADSSRSLGQAFPAHRFHVQPERQAAQVFGGNHGVRRSSNKTCLSLDIRLDR